MDSVSKFPTTHTATSVTHSTATVRTLAFKGIEAVLIEVEVYIGNEMPSFVICGLGDKAITESKERIKSSLKCAGVALPAKRIVVNLSPANIPKEGSHYDLPIALAILKALGHIKNEKLDQYIVMGELSLEGRLKYVENALIAAAEAKKIGCGLLCPFEVGSEAALIEGVSVIAPQNLLQAIQVMNGERALSEPEPESHFAEEKLTEQYRDFQDIKGNENIKRALTIAICGGHNVLLIGAPGVGKSSICYALNTIQPPMPLKELIEVSKIYSAAGMLKNKLLTARPFRSPHHTASKAAITGGGKHCRPGEISLAHEGILFLDELTLWPKDVLDTLRQAMQEKEVLISRVEFSVKYPANFQLIAATNPCECGQSNGTRCPNSPRCSQNYLKKIPAPILDRIHIIIGMDGVPPWELANLPTSKSSQTIKKEIIQARKNPPQKFDNKAIDFLNKFGSSKGISVRKYQHAKSIAETIAALEGTEEVGEIHMKEAVSYIGIGII